MCARARAREHVANWRAFLTRFPFPFGTEPWRGTPREGGGVGGGTAGGSSRACDSRGANRGAIILPFPPLPPFFCPAPRTPCPPPPPSRFFISVKLHDDCYTARSTSLRETKGGGALDRRRGMSARDCNGYRDRPRNFTRNRNNFICNRTYIWETSTCVHVGNATFYSWREHDFPTHFPQHTADGSVCPLFELSKGLTIRSSRGARVSLRYCVCLFSQFKDPLAPSVCGAAGRLITSFSAAAGNAMRDEWDALSSGMNDSGDVLFTANSTAGIDQRGRSTPLLPPCPYRSPDLERDSRLNRLTVRAMQQALGIDGAVDYAVRY